MNQNQQNMPDIALDYVAENEEKFIRIYDQASDQMVGKWLYPQNFLTNQQIADQYAYLNYKAPRVCNVTVPPGIRIKGYTWQNSDKPYIYELESGKGIVFSNDRPLPQGNPVQEPSSPVLIMEYRPDQEAKFVCLYDNKKNLNEPWLLDPKQTEGKTPEQLKAFFGLPYLPKFICDAVLPPQTKILAYALGNVRAPKLYRAEGKIAFSGERSL